MSEGGREGESLYIYVWAYGERLQLDYIDTIQIHDLEFAPSTGMHAKEPSKRALAHSKRLSTRKEPVR